MSRQLDSTALTVGARIREAIPLLSAKERLVARTVLAQYPAAGLESTAALAAAAQVSVPTVVRFVARLGYASYRQFQSSLRDELSERNAGPTVLDTRSSAAAAMVGPESMRVIADSLLRTMEQLPAEEFEKAAEMLARTEGSVFTLGGRFTRVLAEYTALNLRAFRGGVSFLADAQDAISAAADAGRRDCLVIFDVRRYQPESLALARLFRERRASMLLITDPWLSPIAEVASVVLPARVEAPSPMDGLVAPMAVVEALVGSVHRRLGVRSAERLQTWERANRAVSDPLDG